MNTIERILDLIKKNNINAKKLTEEVELSSSSVTDWKKGKANPSYGAIVKIAKYFNVSPEYLECKTDDPKSTVATPQGDVINTTKQEENKKMKSSDYVTKEELTKILESNNAKIIEAMSNLLKEQKSDSETTQDNYLEASGEN